MICSAAVFTSLFNDASPSYENFSTSFRTLYAASLGNFNFEAFNSDLALGGIMLGAYLLAANVLLLNLLIALLSNIYSNIILEVDSEHRAVIIRYYNRWFWDSQYGIFIFVPSPLSYLVILLSPFILKSENPQKINTFFAKAFYLIYAIPQFAIFVFG